MQVLSAFKDLQILTWEVVQNLALDWSRYDEWLSKGKSPVADFLAKIGRIGMAHDQDKHPESKWLVCDPLAVAAAMDPSLIQGCKVRLR